MQIRRIGICFAIGVAAAALSTPASADILADNVNDTHAADNGAFWGVDDAGWLYTPGISYDLSGIDTYFSIPNLTTIENRTVTTAIFLGNRPSDGGTLLGSFSWDSTQAEGKLGGGSFSTPIPLIAGQQYFVGFENVGPMSSTPNVDDLGVNFTADSNATFLSNLYFDSSTNGSCSTLHSFACEDTNMDILGQPILQFFEPSPSGPSAPEPGSAALLAGALGLGLFYSRKFRRSSMM
jgi:hypothetical protein